jgi:hypothetical protein
MDLTIENVIRHCLTPWIQVYHHDVTFPSSVRTGEEDSKNDDPPRRQVPESVDSFRPIVDTVKQLISSIEGHIRGAERAIEKVLLERLSVFKEALQQDRQRTFTEEDFQKVYEFARNMARLFGGGFQASSSAAEASLPPNPVSGSTVAPPARSSMMAFDLNRGTGRI